MHNVMVPRRASRLHVFSCEIYRDERARREKGSPAMCDLTVTFHEFSQRQTAVELVQEHEKRRLDVGGSGSRGLRVHDADMPRRSQGLSIPWREASRTREGRNGKTRSLGALSPNLPTILRQRVISKIMILKDHKVYIGRLKGGRK